MSSPFESKEFVTSLSRGLRVISAFNRDYRRLTLTEVANRCELNRAATRRFLFTLQALGYVETNGKLFWLSPKILELGYAYLTSQPIVETVQPFIERVSSTTGESCSVSVLDDCDVVYVARHLTHHIMTVTLNVGTRLPAYVTSMGRAILAALPDDEVEAILDASELKKLTDNTIVDKDLLKAELRKVRENGYAIVSEELEIGLRSIAVPIKSLRGNVVAAINVSTQAARMSEDDLRQNILPALCSAAREISEVLPY
ncbi:MAG: IclR family transcriptional regulator [Marinobacter sp.]|nr:IclR family transcriptional regulator [Marinobacter sp.]